MSYQVHDGFGVLPSLLSVVEDSTNDPGTEVFHSGHQGNEVQDRPSGHRQVQNILTG